MRWWEQEGIDLAGAREESAEAAGFLTMEEYIRRRQNTVSQYIATQ